MKNDEVPVPSFIQAKAKMSVQINGIYSKFENVPEELNRFVRPALFTTGDEIWELRVYGSATMVRFNGYRFAITTKHQTGDGNRAPDASKFVILIDDATKQLATPPKSIHSPSFEPNEHKSLEDILVYKYDEPFRTGISQHLDLNNVRWSDDEGEVDYSFLIGFPSENVEIELDPNDSTKLKTFNMRWIRQDLERTENQRLDTENRHVFIKHQDSTRLSVEPDGLSGCPVFSIVHDDAKDRYLKFEGIVTNARADRFSVYPSANIRYLLDAIANNEAECYLVNDFL